ncbi:MAG: VCBS repeat-containing protein [Myxococcaceae bacterium]|nr:VCBS repeat-containing protein [Myxococcaceae bacterium]
MRTVMLCVLASCAALPDEIALPQLAPVVLGESDGPGRTKGTACTTGQGTSKFVDVSSASGIQLNNFVPMPPTRIPINDHSRLALVDVDGDGWDDAVMHSLFPNPQAGVPFEHLVFKNKRDGTFEDVSAASGLRDVQAGFLVFGDFDNDGDADCFAGLDIPLAGATTQVLLNDGQGHFARQANAGVEHLQVVANAVLFDFDLDARLDVFTGSGQTSYAGRNAVLRGNGDGTFTDVTATVLKSVVPDQPTNGLVACDYDGDGDQDVFVANYGVSLEGGRDRLWQNQGDGTFIDVAKAAGFDALATGNYFNARAGYGQSLEPSANPVGGNGFGLDCGDADGDGDLDIYLAQISHGDGADYNRLWSDPTLLLLNDNGVFFNAFQQVGLPYNEGDIDAAMTDFDLDGRLDLAVTRTDKYEAGYTDEAQKGWFGLFRQKPDGTFEANTDVRQKATQNVAIADVDHDGDPDLLVGGRDQGVGRPNFLYRNDVTGGPAWLAVELKGDGVHVPRDAFGSRVTLRIARRTTEGSGATNPNRETVIVREKKSSRGTYDSIDGSALLFGLGSDTGACVDGENQVSLTVRWSDGTTKTLAPQELTLSRFVQLTY